MTSVFLLGDLNRLFSLNACLAREYATRKEENRDIAGGTAIVCGIMRIVDDAWLIQLSEVNPVNPVLIP